MHMSTAALLIDHPEVTPPATFDAVIVNQGQQPLDYGLAYTIDHWDGKRWQKTNLAPEVFPQIALILGPGEIGRPNTVEIPAEVESGFYRVTKNATEEGTGTALTLHGLFQIR
jgi:Big-like domain-containing protein